MRTLRKLSAGYASGSASCCSRPVVNIRLPCYSQRFLVAAMVAHDNYCAIAANPVIRTLGVFSARPDAGRILMVVSHNLSAILRPAA